MTMTLEEIWMRVTKASEQILILPATPGFEGDRQSIRYLLKEVAYVGLTPWRDDGRQLTIKRLKVWLKNEELYRGYGGKL